MRRLEGHAYPYVVLLGMPRSVPVRPMSGGVEEASGAPVKRARASVRRAGVVAVPMVAEKGL